MSQMDALFESDLPHLELLNRGKVRDIYNVDDKHMLIVASDRLSAIFLGGDGTTTAAYFGSSTLPAPHTY